MPKTKTTKTPKAVITTAPETASAVRVYEKHEQKIEALMSGVTTRTVSYHALAGRGISIPSNNAKIGKYRLARKGVVGNTTITVEE